jgi:hypothetical protein
MWLILDIFLFLILFNHRKVRKERKDYCCSTLRPLRSLRCEFSVIYISPDPGLRLTNNILLRAPPRASAAADAVPGVRYRHDLGTAQVIAVGMVDVLKHAAPAYLETLTAASAVVYVASHHKGGSKAPA